MTKEEALQNLSKSTDTPTKLMWQRVYFWHLKNENKEWYKETNGTRAIN